MPNTVNLEFAGDASKLAKAAKKGEESLDDFGKSATSASDDMGKATGMVSKATKSIEGSVATARKALGALGIGLGVGFFAALIKAISMTTGSPFIVSNCSANSSRFACND